MLNLSFLKGGLTYQSNARNRQEYSKNGLIWLRNDVVIR